MIRTIIFILVLTICSVTLSNAEDKDAMKEIDAIKAALPKLAIPMHDVGERFQNMYYAAEAGNWALAAYESKHMDEAMNPVKVTRPQKYAAWANYYKKTFEPVNKSIKAEDFKLFDGEYKSLIKTCDGCHIAMGYGYIRMKQVKAPSDQGIEYAFKSKWTDCENCLK